MSGATVSYIAAGQCVIDANQAGTGTYAAAPQVQRTVAVSSAEKLSQSISFTAPASGTAGGSAALSASGGGSGNPVVFSSGSPGVCTVSGATVSYIAAGQCVIDANQAGTGTYAAAPQVQRTVTVSSAEKLSQSISFTAPASGTAGGSAALSASGGGSGNPVVFSSGSPGVCTVSGATVSYIAAGQCVIDANQAGTGTYAAAPQVQRTVAVSSAEKLSQSISFTAPASGTAGGSAALSASGGGSGNPVVFSSGSPGVCTVSGATVSYIAAGQCVIDANQAGTGTYAAAPQVQRTVTVSSAEKLSQSISFTAPASGTAGGSAALSASGGGSGNPVVFSSGSPGVCTVSGATVSYIAAGQCVIDANQAGTGTYAAAPQVQRTVTVSSAEKLSQSISFTAPAPGTAGGSAALSASGGGSGNPVVFSAASGKVCTVSGATVTYTAAGQCVIDANQAGNTTYAAAPQVQQTVTVSPGSLGRADLVATPSRA